jgi:hypothetical protein
MLTFDESAPTFGFSPPLYLMPYDSNPHLFPYRASYPLPIVQNTVFGVKNFQVHGCVWSEKFSSAWFRVSIKGRRS